MNNNEIIADSSFYICFLDDIDDPSFLQLLFSNHFKFLTTKMLSNEVSKSKKFSQIKKNAITLMDFSYDISEILRPFFGKNEILKGEHEVIAFAYMYYQIKKDFSIILDEIGPRRFVERNFTYLVKLMIGTLGFLGKCHCDYHLLSKDKTMNLIEAIKKSKFRVTDNIINSVKQQVMNCQNG